MGTTVTPTTTGDTTLARHASCASSNACPVAAARQALRSLEPQGRQTGRLGSARHRHGRLAFRVA